MDLKVRMKLIVKTSDSKNNSGLSVDNPIVVSSIVEEYKYLENHYSDFKIFTTICA